MGMHSRPYCEQTSFTQFHGIEKESIYSKIREKQEQVRITPTPQEGVSKSLISSFQEDEERIFALKFFFWMFFIFGGFIFSSIGYFYYKLWTFQSSRNISKHNRTLRLFLYFIIGLGCFGIAAYIGMFMIDIGVYSDSTILPALGLLIIPVLFIRLIRRDFTIFS